MRERFLPRVLVNYFNIAIFIYFKIRRLHTSIEFYNLWNWTSY